MSAPETKLPDPWANAAAQLDMQQKLNLQTNALNRPNQYTPYGNTTWNKAHTKQTQTLPEDVQAALSAQQAGQKQLSQAALAKVPQAVDAMAQPLDTSNLQPWQSTDFSSLGAIPTADQATRQRVEDAYYKRAQNQMDPQYAQQEAQLRTRLAQQGLSPTSEAYGTEVGNFYRGKNTAYENALNDAIINGGNQMQQQFGMELAGRQQGANEIMSSANANNALRQSQLAQETYLRGLPLQELSALYGGGVQQPNAPGFNAAPGSQAPDYLGAVQNNYAAQLASNAAGAATTGQYFGAGLNALNSDAASKYLWQPLMNGHSSNLFGFSASPYGG